MEEFRKWWTAAVQDVIDFLGRGFESLYNGILYDWNTRIFVFAMGIVLVIGLVALWRRRA